MTTIACRAWKEKSDVNYVFGISSASMGSKYVPDLSVNVHEDKSDLGISKNDPVRNELVCTAENIRGADGRVTFTLKDEPQYIYIQVKIARSGKVQVAEMIANCICNTLDLHFEHVKKSTKLDHISIVLYIWSADIVKPPLDEINKEVTQFHLKKYKSQKIRKSHEMRVAKYMSEFYEVNVHVVDKAVMEKWIAPTFVPIAKMVSVEVAK